MTCENAQQNIILAQYNELPDELQFPLEQHVSGCEECRREWKALLALNEELALMPMVEPSPNLLAASRMRLDEALDLMPARSVMQRFFGNAFRWLGYVQGAPALTTLLLGVGFLGGRFLERYEARQVVVAPPWVDIHSDANGVIASVSGIVQTPNSNVVQVKYNRLVPEVYQGAMTDPRTRELLVLGAKLAVNNDVHADSVALLANECAAGHNCDGDGGVTSGGVQTAGFRTTLLTSLRYDKSPAERLRALQGLQRYVAQDQHVRDAVLSTLMHDPSSEVRGQAVSMLAPVQADSSVRQVLRTVSTQDANPAIRNASFNVLQGTSDIQ